MEALIKLGIAYLYNEGCKYHVYTTCWVLKYLSPTVHHIFALTIILSYLAYISTHVLYKTVNVLKTYESYYRTD